MLVGRGYKGGEPSKQEEPVRVAERGECLPPVLGDRGI